MRQRWFAWLFTVLAATFVTLVSMAARADNVPVIAAGRESEIVALVQPYFGGKVELTPGFKLGDIKVEPRAVRIHVVAADGAKGVVRLEHPNAAPDAPLHSKSFAITLEDAHAPAMRAALDVLVTTIRTNDRADFWVNSRPETGDRSPREAAPSLDPRRWTSAFSLLGDGVVLFTLGLAFILAHIRRALRGEPRYVVRALLAIVVGAAVLRLIISREAAMNAWPYERIIPLARQAFYGAVLPWLSKTLSFQVSLTDVNFKATTLVALVTPLVFFAHALYVLGDSRKALFATALLALLPLHIRFSRSDTELIQSLATSSLTFVVLYTSLRDPSLWWRALCFVLLPVFSLATYFVRPENLFFWFVDVGAILLLTHQGATTRRKIFALIEVTAAALYALITHLIALHRDSLGEALRPRTVFSALLIVFDTQLNTLINPRVTPPGLLLLAVIGAVTLWRSDRRRAAFLVLWLSGFFVVHSYVIPSEPMMQARYHLHLITPFVFLAASSLPTVLEWPRRIVIAGTVYLVASPVIHLRFERDIDFTDMHEYAFVRAASAKTPDGCTVLELSPAIRLSEPGHVFASRFQRMALRLDKGVVRSAYQVVNSGVVSSGPEGRPYETLSEAARVAIATPPPCLMVYEGVACFSHRPADRSRAPVCDELYHALSLDTVMTTTFRSRLYNDTPFSRGQPRPDGGLQWVTALRPGEELRLSLLVAHAPR